jgi:hypothetical protein
MLYDKRKKSLKEKLLAKVENRESKKEIQDIKVGKKKTTKK